MTPKAAENIKLGSARKLCAALLTAPSPEWVMGQWRQWITMNGTLVRRARQKKDYRRVPCRRLWREKSSTAPEQIIDVSVLQAAVEIVHRTIQQITKVAMFFFFEKKKKDRHAHHGAKPLLVGTVVLLQLVTYLLLSLTRRQF